MTASFATRLLDWFEVHGRHDLPWQRDVSAYRVWVSEIMLQQTQVATVIGYFERFMQRFPDVASLAEAPLDEVLARWSGLGYYARARNLHRAAQRICAEHDGCLPANFDALIALPGIGRSTAGAILSLSGGQRHAILDGNVKRVLARHAGESGWPGSAPVARRLWQIAEQRTPQQRSGEYNQAMMDLGATLCTRTRPDCARCPVAADCVARATARQADYPGPRPRKALPERAVRMLVVRDATGGLLLERRPPSGIWGGLWSLPEIAVDADPLAWCADTLRSDASLVRRLAARRHSFTHFHLHIEPLEILLETPGWAVLEGAERVWYNATQINDVGVPAPVARLIAEIVDTTGREKD